MDDEDVGILAFIGLIIVFAIVVGMILIQPDDQCNNSCCDCKNSCCDCKPMGDCIKTKTSVVTVQRDGFGPEYVRDSDGITYSWEGSVAPYGKIDHHNVTFEYNECISSWGSMTYMRTVSDYGSSCCACSRGC